MAGSFAQRWSVWAAGYGGSQTTDGNAGVGSNTATSRIFGTAVGADYRFSPSTLAGFALAGGGTNFSIANGLGSGRSDLFQAGAFIRHTVGPAYISAALAYGWQDITTDRTITIAGVDQLRAKFNANALSGRVEGGYRFVTPGMGITPYAAGQFTTFDLPAYAEQAIVWRQHFCAELRRQERHGVAQRAGCSHRQILGDDGCDLHPARPRWPGRMTSTPTAISPPRSRRCPAHRSSSTARRWRLRRRPRHRLGRNQMAERLLARRHLRGRVLRRHRKLRRQGRRALRLVVVDFRCSHISPFRGGDFARAC